MLLKPACLLTKEEKSRVILKLGVQLSWYLLRSFLPGKRLWGGKGKLKDGPESRKRL